MRLIDGARWTVMERDDDGARQRDGARGLQSKVEWGVRVSEMEWEWEWEGMRETVSCFESFFSVVFWCNLLQDTWRAEKKSSPMDSISTYKNRVYWIHFLCIKTKFVGLGFFVGKPSSTNSIFGLTWTLCPTQILVK